MDKPLWEPSSARKAASNMTAFFRKAEADWGIKLADYEAAHRWSVDEREQFWSSIWSFCGVVASQKGNRVLVDGDRMPGAKFFPDARLNFAENLLRHRGPEPAMIFRGENGDRRALTRDETYDLTSRLSQALKAHGIKPGDRIAAYLPNIPEAVIAMLATTSLGGVWSSCSPDFGVRGVLDRFGQIEPRVLFAVDGYHYAGKRIDTRPRLAEILAELPTVERVVIIPFLDTAPDLKSVPKAVALGDFIDPFKAGPIAFEQVAFNDPLYILFSSGTTGVPKCIVHGVGGTLLKHLSEHMLHTDVKPGDRLFYFTTLGWMMWNWLVSGLASGATLLLFDGSPFHPNEAVLWDLAEREGMTVFGTSAKYIDALSKSGFVPKDHHDLSRLKTMTSTGSPLVAEGFEFVYRGIKADMALASISGGTDLCGCFVLGNPLGAVWRGEIQAPALGIAVAVFNDEGQPVTEEKGELVCTKSFPAMPIRFWNDPDGAKYQAAYFERFPGIWCHGDYAEITAHGGTVIYGRSDATLNPGGVRIGTAEIYRQVEQVEEVMESIVIGQEWDSDVRVVLFVRLRPGLTLDAPLIDKIRRRIRENASPRHVPAKVIQVTDIPRTRSGKIVELAVRDVVHGRPVKNIEALDNPQALDLYKNRVELNT
ncbi:MAG: acetoacetate--CoA ligase [Alphaproteobacteria bacterium]|nr:acetoacetate--CoA ligase [Alphaproteobacteria bacterium]